MGVQIGSIGATSMNVPQQPQDVHQEPTLPGGPFSTARDVEAGSRARACVRACGKDELRGRVAFEFYLPEEQCVTPYDAIHGTVQARPHQKMLSPEGDLQARRTLPRGIANQWT